jgi:hypothetical protein
MEILMPRMFKTLPSIALACAAAVTLAACNSSPNAPSSSSAGGAVGTEAGPSGETLKAQAPTVLAPANNLTLDTRRPVMTVSTVSGRFVGGTYSYEFELMTDGNSVIDRITVQAGASSATWSYPTDLERDTPYRFRARARKGSAFGPWSTTSRFITVKEKRAADPDPNSICFDSMGNAVRNCIPPPNMLHIVQRVVAENPGILSPQRSCQEEQWGGDHVRGWEFMDKLVDALRQEDTRFGYNCKRGNCGDPSLDVVVYHYGSGPDQGSSRIWAWDVIGSHCGPGATGGWSHITNIFGSGGGFTSRGRW